MDLYFSDELNQVIAQSRGEALRLRHNYIDSGHLLLGMLHGGEGVVTELLKKLLSVPLSDLLLTIEKLMQTPSTTPLGPADDLPITIQAERILKLSYVKARNFKSSTINSEHLLLSILDYQQSIASQILRHFGVRYKAISALMGGPPEGIMSGLQRFWAKLCNR